MKMIDQLEFAMRLCFARHFIKTLVRAGEVALFVCFSFSAIAFDSGEAINKVKAMPCKDGQTVEQVLDGSIRRRSQRDLGWRSFQEQGYYDIERAVLVNKGMELRYRWRVFADGSVQLQSGRAEKLCGLDAD